MRVVREPGRTQCSDMTSHKGPVKGARNKNYILTFRGPENRNGLDFEYSVFEFIKDAATRAKPAIEISAVHFQRILARDKTIVQPEHFHKWEMQVHRNEKPDSDIKCDKFMSTENRNACLKVRTCEHTPGSEGLISDSIIIHHSSLI